MTDVLSRDEIDNLLDSLDSNDDAVPDFVTIDPGAVIIKEMDFRRQDKFTKKQLNYIGSIHEVFAIYLSRLFSNGFGENSKIYVNFWQGHHEEFIRTLLSDVSSICIKVKLLKGSALFHIEHSLLMKILYPQFDSISIRAAYKLTKLDYKKLRRFFKRILPILRKSWEKVANLRMKIESINSSPQCFNTVPPNEQCAVTVFDCNIGGDDGILTFCIPYTTIEPVVDKLADRDLVCSTKIKGDAMKPSTINEALDLTPLPIRAELGNSEISIKEIKELHPGSIIELNRLVTDPIDVYIKDIKIANAKAVVINNDYLGIKITEMVGEKKMDEPPCLEGPGVDPNGNK